MLAVLAAMVMVLAFPAAAHGAVWTEGTAARPFGLADRGGLLLSIDAGDPSLVVPYVASTAFAGAAIEFEPRSVRVTPSGTILVAGGKHGVILELSMDGRVLHQYTGTDIQGLQRPFDALELSGGGMLIVDRAETQGEGRVFRVDSSLKVVWQFGGTSGPGAGEVFDPFTAEPLPGGRTLVADSLGYRIIEIDDATEQIIWSYGEFKVPGSGAGHLNRPHSAERLASGNTLICDSENQRVIEVSRDKKIVWSYGTGVAGSAAGQLKNPNSARRLADGDTVICDSDNNRVIEVDKSGHIVQICGASDRMPSGGGLVDPRASVVLADGRTLIADLGNTRLATYGVPAHREYAATSNRIDPQSGARKRFMAIRTNATVPAGAMLAVEYSVNAGSWTGVQGTTLPSDAIGTDIRYRVRLTTGLGNAAPVLKDISIEWAIAGASAPKNTGSGSGSHVTTATAGTGSGSGSGAGSGSAEPSGTTEIAGGSTGGTGGTGGVGVTASANLSGWVMSEVKDDSLGLGSAAGGTGYGGTSLDSTAPGVELLLAVYSVGLAWSPTTRLVTRLITVTLSR